MDEHACAPRDNVKCVAFQIDGKHMHFSQIPSLLSLDSPLSFFELTVRFAENISRLPEAEYRLPALGYILDMWAEVVKEVVFQSFG